MKEEWKQFLDILPYQKTELHKDEFQRKYEPENLQLPVILMSNAKNVQLLASAEEINQCTSLQQIKKLVKSKLKR